MTPEVAFAAGSDSWTGMGTNGSLWTDAGNWSAGVPQNGDSVTIGPTNVTATPHVTGMPGGLKLKRLTLTNSSLDGGAVTITGAFTWSVAQNDTGSLKAALTVQGPATISGPGQKVTLAPLAFKGATEVSGGLVLTEDTGRALTNTGTFTLKPGAEIEAHACCVSRDQFVNSGTLRMTAAGSATLDGMDLHDTGTLSVGKGSILDVIVGPVELSKGVAVAGSGTVDFDAGALVTLASGVSIGSGATVQLNGNAEFTGTGGFTGTGRFDWTGGNIEGNLDVAKTITTAITGKSIKTLTSVTSKPVVLSLHGKTTVKGPGQVDLGIARITNSGTFTEFSGALLQGRDCCVAPAQFVNTGTLTVPGATKGMAGIALLDLKDQGAISIGKGSVLHVTVGPVELTTGKRIAGGGTLELDASASVTLARNVSVGPGTTVQLNGEATLNGTGSFTGTGHLLWTGGSIQGNLDVAKTITTTISGPLTKNLGSLTSKPVLLTLRGKTTVTGTGPLNLGSAATLANLGTMTMHSGTAINALTCCVAPDHFANGGNLVVTASPANTAITNLGFASTGQVKLINGTLTVSGTGYHQAKSGVLAVTAKGTRAGSDYGRLIVNGRAALAGTISVTIGGSFKPKAGQELAVLSYHTRAGKFTATTGKVKFKVSYQASGATIRFS